MQLNTYLNYGGNCEQAFRFYEEHLGGKITMLMRHGEQPDDRASRQNGRTPSCMRGCRSGGTELLAADIPPDRFQPMRSAYLSLSVDSIDEAERSLRAAYGWRSDLHAHGRDVLRESLRDVA